VLSMREDPGVVGSAAGSRNRGGRRPHCCHGADVGSGATRQAARRRIGQRLGALRKI